MSQIPFICKLLNGWRTPAAATATLTGFLGPGLDAGPFIARTDSYQSICIGSLQSHLCRLAVVQSVSSKQGLLTIDTCPAVWSADVDIATLMTPRLLHQGVFTTVYELRRGFVTLANINCCVSSHARGTAWPRGQLSTICIRVPNRGSIRSNTNSPFGPLFGPVRI